MIAIAYNVVHAQDAHRDVRRRIGADGAWDAYVLNGHGRAFDAAGAGAFSLKWMAAGRARYTIDRRAHTVTRDCAVLLDCDQPYRVSFEGAASSESYCLFFAPTLVAEAWASVEAADGEPREPALRPFPTVPFAPQRELAARLRKLHAAGIGADGEHLEALLLEVLADVVTIARRHRRLATRVPAVKPATRAHLLGLLEGACQRLVDSDGVGWTLERLAIEVGLSRFHLLRLFRALYGITPLEYAERLKMSAAAAQLRVAERPVGELAAQLGYDSASAFARAFRRHTGTTPTRWRAARGN